MLMGVVLEAIKKLVPLAKPSPEPKEAGKEFHDAIRRQKKAHWDDFREDGANIWQSARYLKPGGDTISDKILPLKRPDGTKTRDKADQAEELLTAIDTRQDSRGGRGGQDIIRRRDVRTPTHKPLWSKKTTIDRAGTAAPAGADLQGVEKPQGASIVVNGHTSERRQLPQAGLPQGSPLSPVLFLFFNADLVTGPTAETNRAGIQATIDRALDWERRSGATFEGDKKTIIHFAHNAERTSDTPFMIKGKEVRPTQSAKILGVVMDGKLRYKEHMARAAAKGLSAAMCLRRLKMLSPQTARQLFTATVAPTMDYTSTVAQKVGAQAITGAFRTAATAVLEAEASIPTIGERHTRAGTRLWINLHTLPKTHSLAGLKISNSRRYLSLKKQLALAQEGNTVERMETIQACTLPLWHSRLPIGYDLDQDMATETANRMEGILVATTASEKAGRVGLS
ncbi:hypothetical protein MRS44_017236 [Fusarium solani]|uniref:uncharacterized protein n=1 Tax=Fusarium solani TaxID=169388 RepID=UPI0032C463FB|nr:hypothetical protein MRS44_017236 [Fusarium solani]